MRQYLVAHPLDSAVCGDLVHQVEQQIIAEACSTNQAAAVSIETYCTYQRNQFGYQAASPLERALIEHVVLCWLRLYVTENRYEQRMKENLSLTQADYWERKLSTHQTRYLRAVETLARIRKLGIHVQINVARQQIVAGT